MAKTLVGITGVCATLSTTGCSLRIGLDDGSQCVTDWARGDTYDDAILQDPDPELSIQFVDIEIDEPFKTWEPGRSIMRVLRALADEVLGDIDDDITEETIDAATETARKLGRRRTLVLVGDTYHLSGVLMGWPQ